jgi:Phage integrase, N-terminal SAM-like domain
MRAFGGVFGRNLAPRSIVLYTGAVKRLAAFLESRSMPTSVEAIAREHVETYIAELVATRAANTGRLRIPGAETLFRMAA